MYCPWSAPDLPAMDSMSIPMVIREGNALGLMMQSGVMPEAVKGMSICGHSTESTPFWPCREENLSPTTGLRLYRNLMFTRCTPSSESPSRIRTSST